MTLSSLRHGDTQVFGQNGQPQTWANVLGTMSDPDGVSSLTYSLNGGPAQPLSIGVDLRRLASPGDFNVEIAYVDLAKGDNTVTITAVDANGGTSTRTVTVTRAMGLAPLPYDTVWASRGSITEAAQVVDGPWSLVPGGGVRADVLAYDRLLAIGDIGWTDYEVTIPVTAFALGPNAGTPQSGALLVGIGLHWQGHTRTRNEQPRTRFWPTGAFTWHRWQDSCRFEFQGNLGPPLVRNSRTRQFGTTYVMKARAETVADGVAYFYKVWPAAEAEPAAWDLQIVEDSGPPSDSVLLIAHRVDAVFGDVVVTPLP